MTRPPTHIDNGLMRTIDVMHGGLRVTETDTGHTTTIALDRQHTAQLARALYETLHPSHNPWARLAAAETQAQQANTRAQRAEAHLAYLQDK